jgi:hypothetical protein
MTLEYENGPFMLLFARKGFQSAPQVESPIELIDSGRRILTERNGSTVIAI